MGEVGLTFDQGHQRLCLGQQLLDLLGKLTLSVLELGDFSGVAAFARFPRGHHFQTALKGGQNWGLG
jgi:hypothetical protein